MRNVLPVITRVRQFQSTSDDKPSDDKPSDDIPPATGNNPGTVIWIAAIAVCGAAVTITSACRYKKENR